MSFWGRLAMWYTGVLMYWTPLIFTNLMFLLRKLKLHSVGEDWKAYFWTRRLLLLACRFFELFLFIVYVSCWFYVVGWHQPLRLFFFYDIWASELLTFVLVWGTLFFLCHWLYRKRFDSLWSIYLATLTTFAACSVWEIPIYIRTIAENPVVYQLVLTLMLGLPRLSANIPLFYIGIKQKWFNRNSIVSAFTITTLLFIAFGFWVGIFRMNNNVYQNDDWRIGYRILWAFIFLLIAKQSIKK